MGLVCPRIISVGPTRPIVSLIGETWWSELRTVLRSTGLPQMIWSHSVDGNPVGALCELIIQFLIVA